jgi:hypothetical protein
MRNQLPPSLRYAGWAVAALTFGLVAGRPWMSQEFHAAFDVTLALLLVALLIGVIVWRRGRS